MPTTLSPPYPIKIRCIWCTCLLLLCRKSKRFVCLWCTLTTDMKIPICSVPTSSSFRMCEWGNISPNGLRVESCKNKRDWIENWYVVKTLKFYLSFSNFIFRFLVKLFPLSGVSLFPNILLFLFYCRLSPYRLDLSMLSRWALTFLFLIACLSS